MENIPTLSFCSIVFNVAVAIVVIPLIHCKVKYNPSNMFTFEWIFKELSPIRSGNGEFNSILNAKCGIYKPKLGIYTPRVIRRGTLVHSLGSMNLSVCHEAHIYI